MTRLVTSPALIAAILVVSCAASTELMAEPVYRSVDAAGEVSFSSKPPASAVEVEEVVFEPGPTEEEISAARERMQEQIDNAERLSESRRADQAARQEQLDQRRYENPPYPQQQADDPDYYGYPYRYGYRPGYPHRPVKPPPPVEPAPVTSSTPALLPKSRR